MENYYKLLGVSQDADISIIRSSFRKKAKNCHPDLFRNTSEKEQKKQQKIFVRLTQAYETLADPKKRRIFDSRLKDIITETKQTSDQKKQRSSSFSSKFNNLNKKTRESKESKESTFTETEDTLEDLICDIKKIMDQFGVQYRDPLDVLVKWAINVFHELSLSSDENFNNKNDEDESKKNYKTSTGMNNEPSYNFEDELDRLKKSVKSKSKSNSNSNEYNNLENEIDLELRSLKKKYRI